MLRNGLRASRRSIRATAYILPTTFRTGVKQPLNHERPFVCFLCQARAYTTKGRSKSGSTMLDAVKRLERHVQVLETKYKDYIQQKDAEAKIPPLEITEDMHDKAYAALMAPQASQSLLPLLEKPLAARLPEPIVLRLGGSLVVAEQEKSPQFRPILQEIQKNGGFTGLPAVIINRLINVIPFPQRAQLADIILGMMEQDEVSPDTLTYDLLMLATADEKDRQHTEELFTQMKERGLPRTVHSYAHLLKALSDTKEVDTASAIFQQMHAEGIKPNLVVYTSLLKVCINRKELDTAWQIFQLLKYRSTETAPDVDAFSLMIHACALRGEAERALDLFNEMVNTRGLRPDVQAYNAVIHACAVRTDYFLEAWKHAINMQKEGMGVDRRTLNLLLQACGKGGELTRSRVIIRHMMASGVEELQPDEHSFQMLFRAYATKSHRAQKLMGEINFPSPTISEHAQEELRKIPFKNNAVLDTRKGILSEAKAMLLYLWRERRQFYSTRILNAYLDVCLNHHGNKELQKAYKNYYHNPNQFSSRSEIILEAELATSSPSSPPASSSSPQNTPSSSQNWSPSIPLSPSKNNTEEDHDPESESDPEGDELSSEPPSDPSSGPSSSSTTSLSLKPYKPKPHRNIYTFEIALEYARKQRAMPFARRVWADRMEYTRTPEYWTVLVPHERRQADFYAEKLIIDIHAKCGYVEEAMDRLEALKDDYGWDFEHIKILYDAARERDDFRKIARLRTIAKMEEPRW